MKDRLGFIAVGILGLLFFATCGKKADNPPDPPNPDTNTVTYPVDTNGQTTAGSQFNEDSAYAYIEKQMSFGPRVPNSEGHRKCGDYILLRLTEWADEVKVQNATVTAHTGAQLKIRNFVARFNPSNPNRVALFAHWDTRPNADRTEATKNVPVPGADDGGSGVGVLMEMARQMSIAKPNIGVDIILFDAEDYGNPGGAPETYCLGSQYWAKNNPISGYTANYGILLDMVGAKDAKFLKEGYSTQFASAIVDKVWNVAMSSGYGNYFIMNTTDPITDDHYFVNTLANIPTIDIVNYDRSFRQVGFGDHWHTPNDNMGIIDKNVLKAVGQTVMNVIYSEQ